MKEVHEGRREAIKEGRIVGEYLYSIFELFHVLEQLLIVFFLRQSFHVRQTGCLHFQWLQFCLLQGITAHDCVCVCVCVCVCLESLPSKEGGRERVHCTLSQ